MKEAPLRKASVVIARYSVFFVVVITMFILVAGIKASEHITTYLILAGIFLAFCYGMRFVYKNKKDLQNYQKLTAGERIIFDGVIVVIGVIIVFAGAIFLGF